MAIFDWLTVEPSQGGGGNYESSNAIKISASPYYGRNSRTMTLRASLDDNPEKYSDTIVTQERRYGLPDASTLDTSSSFIKGTLIKKDDIIPNSGEVSFLILANSSYFKYVSNGWVKNYTVYLTDIKENDGAINDAGWEVFEEGEVPNDIGANKGYAILIVGEVSENTLTSQRSFILQIKTDPNQIYSNYEEIEYEQEGTEIYTTPNGIVDVDGVSSQDITLRSIGNWTISKKE